MKTMKVIDLLNKIANGEKVPRMVNYDDCILTYDEETQGYYNEPECTYDLFGNIHYKLNDEVEIIEDTPKEDKKIEKLDLSKYYGLNDTEKHIMNKINEIIDKVNEE